MQLLRILKAKYVVMSPFSLFSSVKISDRIDAFRNAERNLFEFARTRFWDDDNVHPSQRENHHFELFDTPVGIPSVIKEGSAAASCQLRDHYDASESKNSSQDANANSNYSIHGVKVINKRLSNISSNNLGTVGTKQAPLVLLHGYANGALYFYRNLMGLSHHFGSIYALDMLGWGLSSRPKFDLITTPSTDDETTSTQSSCDNDGDTNEVSPEVQRRVSSAESFFVESLEDWRKHHNLPKLTLAGHSMGGYLSVAYAERYPQHVEKLILLSPVGVPQRQPNDLSRINSLPFHIRAMIKTARFLFNQGITPGSFLRSLPHSKSKAMVDGYILNRLPVITCPEEQEHLAEYLYQNSMLPGSGEYCLPVILSAGAFARIPLIDRIPNLTKDGDKDGMEVHMIYGQNDWMDWKGGMDVQRLCHQKRQEKLNGGSPPKVFVYGVREASHLLMLDNYAEFNAAITIAGHGKLPPNMPRPVEVFCDEVAASRPGLINDPHIIVGEDGAQAFFRGGRFNRKQDADDSGDVSTDGSFDEDQKEQLA